MGKDFIPATDGGLLAFAANLSALIAADPAAYGLSVPIAALLATKQSAYAAALRAATDPATRGGATVFAKDAARADLVAYCRLLNRAIQGNLTVTGAQRHALGLTVRDASPSPIPPPADAPWISIDSTRCNTVTLRLLDPARPTRRAKPKGVDGIALFSHVGPTPPPDEAHWRFEGNATRTAVDIVLPAGTPPGARVWFTAYYFNHRKQRGPAAPAAGTHVAGGAVMAA